MRGLSVSAQEVQALGHAGYFLREPPRRPLLPRALCKAVLARPRAWMPARVGAGVPSRLEELRSDRMVWLTQQDEPRVWSRFEALRLALQRAARVSLSRFDMQLAHYAQGAFYARHVDAATTTSTAATTRRLTAVTYLNECQGGRLRLYPMHSQEPVDVVPSPGVLCVFRSDVVPHEGMESQVLQCACGALTIVQCCLRKQIALQSQRGSTDAPVQTSDMETAQRKQRISDTSGTSGTSGISGITGSGKGSGTHRNKSSSEGLPMKVLRRALSSAAADPARAHNSPEHARNLCASRRRRRLLWRCPRSSSLCSRAAGGCFSFLAPPNRDAGIQGPQDQQPGYAWLHPQAGHPHALTAGRPRSFFAAYVAPSATLAGNVEVWDYAHVGYEVAVRGDVKLV